MKKTNLSIAYLAIVGVFLCVGCNDGGVESGGGDAVAYLNWFFGSKNGKQPLIDERNGKTYRTTTIGIQTWMAENLNYKTGNSRCYGDEDSNCVKYGRLYDWATATNVCPEGWRLPSIPDMDYLTVRLGYDYDVIGGKLKAKSGWSYCDLWNLDGVNADGTDNYGFSALPGGRFYRDAFEEVQCVGYWWAWAEELDVKERFVSIEINSYFQRIEMSGHIFEDGVSLFEDDSEHMMHSVRCLLDD